MNLVLRDINFCYTGRGPGKVGTEQCSVPTVALIFNNGYE